MISSRRLWPREYGAYAELGFPLLTALFAGRPTVSALALSAVAIAGFLLHEPYVVWRGARGERLRAELAAPALARMKALVGIGALAGLIGVSLGPPTVRLALFPPGFTALLLARRVLLEQEKTVGAELLMAMALVGMVLPVGLAAGLDGGYSVGVGAVWLTTFVTATLLVHAIKAWHREPADHALRNGAPAMAMVIVIAAIAAIQFDVVPLTMGLAALPTPAVVLVAWQRWVHPRQLRRVGWSIVAANAVTLVLLVVR